MKAIIMSSVFDKRELEGEVRTSVAKESNMTGGRGRHLELEHLGRNSIGKKIITKIIMKKLHIKKLQ